MTDDQGWGDFGFHGNPHLKTPHLDRAGAPKRRADAVLRLAGLQSHAGQPDDRALQLSHRRDRHVSGSLDDGRRRSDPGRDVRRGRLSHRHLWQMAPGRQLSVACRSTRALQSRSCIAAAAWSNRPIRPAAATSIPCWMHNGRDEKAHGYCSDVFTDAAIDFIEQHRDEPFFAYLAFNCPHTPLQVPDEYHRPLPGPRRSTTTRPSCMAWWPTSTTTSADCLAKLDELKLADNTIVVFLTDNGPQVPRYNGHPEDLKGSVHDGGIHVPCLVRWPGHCRPARRSTRSRRTSTCAPRCWRPAASNGPRTWSSTA